MPVTITPTDDVKPDEIKLGAVNIRVRNQPDTTPSGVFLPVGSVSVTATLSGYREKRYIDDLLPINLPDIAAWVKSLAESGDPLAGEAAMRFQRCIDDLKWNVSLRGSQLGLCERPTT